MFSRTTCPVCGGAHAKSYWALVAPFLRIYALDRDAPTTTQLRDCLECGHRFFRERYTEAEMARLYSGYRGERYLRIRQAWEPWYSTQVNDQNLSAAVIHNRQQALRELLQLVGIHSAEGRVLVDVGGDAGQFIPQDLCEEAYVVEASDRKPIDGVQGLSQLDALPRPADVVLCLHVLEHLPDPKRFLQGLVASQRLAPGCMVVLEVPQERIRLGPGLGRTWYANGLCWLANQRWLVIPLDLASTVARIKIGWLMAPLFIKQHEHVQFYTAQSLQRLAEGVGLEVVLLLAPQDSQGAGFRGVIRLVARVPVPGSEAGVVVRA